MSFQRRTSSEQLIHTVIMSSAFLKGIIVSNFVTNKNIEKMNTLSWNDAEVAERVARGQEREMTARMLKDEMPDRTGFRVREPQVIYENRIVIDLGQISCHIERIGSNYAGLDGNLHSRAKGRVYWGLSLSQRQEPGTVDERIP